MGGRRRGAVTKIFLTGGTGFVGRTLTKALCEQGHEVTVLTRAPGSGYPLPPGAILLVGDPTMPGAWQEQAAGHEVFINLAGASIFGRWNDRVKKEIRESRVKTTSHLVTAMARGDGAGKHLWSASAIGYYGFRRDEALDENAGAGDDFLANLTVEWEAAACNAKKFGGKVTICRFGIVLGRNGGMLQKLVPLFRSRLGTSLGTGEQWISWIHERDLGNIFLFLLDHPDLEGPINCTAPNPVRNREMTRALAEALGVPALLPSVPRFMVQLLMGEFGSVILEGQKVLPRRLLEKGFTFQFPTIREALEDLLKIGGEPNPPPPAARLASE